jgi:hypothetical protein
VLGLCLAALAAVAGVMAARQFGNAAYQASAVAAGLIWFVGSAALVIISLPQTNAARLNAVLLAVLIRTLLPMVVMLVLQRTEHPLMAAGLGGLIVIHYLAGLAIETFFCLRIVTASNLASPSLNPLAGGR